MRNPRGETRTTPYLLLPGVLPTRFVVSFTIGAAAIQRVKLIGR